MLLAVLSAGAAHVEAQTITLGWDPNPERDIAGYIIGYGTAPGRDDQTIDVRSATEWTLSGFSEGPVYYFRVYAYSHAGLRSAPSLELSATFSGGTVIPGPAGGCSPIDPFASLGGGTCVNGNWLPPGMTGGDSAPPPPSEPQPAPSAGGCATPDPFVSLGGGTCVDGNWLPPGMAPPSGSTAPPPSLPPPPPTTGGCVTPDPFVSLGGGTCWDGNWLPPGMPIPGGGTVPPSSPVPPAPTGSCQTPDPFVTLGGGTCVNGNWLPPGMVTPSVSTAMLSTSSGGCSTPDPFIGLPGLIGECRDGGWVPIAGVSTTGTIRIFNLAETFWGIAGDDGHVYRPSVLEPAFQVEGLRVAFEGSVGPIVMIPTPVTPIVIRSMSVK
jgi:hypothetical protein